ncbi:MAG: molybdenum cofactor guanylyltransferase [Chthoniobacterales bacterium]
MNLSAVLLAGGESRRMGENKATLLFHGKPLWQRQLDLLRKLQPAEIFVSARTDPAWRPNDVDLVLDATPLHGPLSGLAAALARIRSSHLLALAIDMPFMTAVYLQSLGKRIRSGCGVVPKIGRRSEALAAIYPAEALVDLRAALRGPDFSLQSMVQQLIGNGKLRPTQVRKSDQPCFANLNEPHDLA